MCQSAIRLGLTIRILYMHRDSTKNNASSLYELANNGTLAKILSDNLINDLNESASILEITSMIPEVSNAQYADKIYSRLHGISDSYDVEKRQIADSILKHADTFEAITFLLSNGDMYMEEPYDRQLDLSRNNFAFRDYYQGAIDTKQAFQGDVIVSSSTWREGSSYFCSNISEKGFIPLRDLERYIKS